MGVCLFSFCIEFGAAQLSHILFLTFYLEGSLFLRIEYEKGAIKSILFPQYKSCEWSLTQYNRDDTFSNCAALVNYHCLINLPF